MDKLPEIIFVDKGKNTENLNQDNLNPDRNNYEYLKETRNRFYYILKALKATPEQLEILMRNMGINGGKRKSRRVKRRKTRKSRKSRKSRKH